MRARGRFRGRFPAQLDGIGEPIASPTLTSSRASLLRGLLRAKGWPIPRRDVAPHPDQADDAGSGKQTEAPASPAQARGATTPDRPSVARRPRLPTGTGDWPRPTHWTQRRSCGSRTSRPIRSTCPPNVALTAGTRTCPERRNERSSRRDPLRRTSLPPSPASRQRFSAQPDETRRATLWTVSVTTSPRCTSPTRNRD